MRKLAAFLLVITVFFFAPLAFSSGSYDLSSARKDADIVHLYFAGSSSDAADAFNRLYDFFYDNSQEYLLNMNKGKFHKSTCPSKDSMKNVTSIYCSRELLLALGFSPCGNCHP